MVDVLRLPWRIGARPYRSIYAVVPEGADVLVASAVVTADAAAVIVAVHNASLDPQPFGGF